MNKTIGEKIRECLDEKDMTQKELSILTKIKAPKLNLIITDKRKLKTDELEVICYALREGPDRFLTPRPPLKIGA